MLQLVSVTNSRHSSLKRTGPRWWSNPNRSLQRLPKSESLVKAISFCTLFCCVPLERNGGRRRLSHVTGPLAYDGNFWTYMCFPSWFAFLVKAMWVSTGTNKIKIILQNVGFSTFKCPTMFSSGTWDLDSSTPSYFPAESFRAQPHLLPSVIASFTIKGTSNFVVLAAIVSWGGNGASGAPCGTIHHGSKDQVVRLSIETPWSTMTACPTLVKTCLLTPSIVCHPAMRRHCEGQLGSYKQNHAAFLYLDPKSAKLKHTNLTTFRVCSATTAIKINVNDPGLSLNVFASWPPCNAKNLAPFSPSTSLNHVPMSQCCQSTHWLAPQLLVSSLRQTYLQSWKGYCGYCQFSNWWASLSVSLCDVQAVPSTSEKNMP
jgi:hypothetical protein